MALSSETSNSKFQTIQKEQENNVDIFKNANVGHHCILLMIFVFCHVLQSL